MTPQEFYCTQSPMSDPGKYASLYDALPDDLPSLRRIIQSIYIHYRGGPSMGFPISEERIVQVDNRRVEAILGSLIAQEDQPLTVARPPEKRVVGCCRDASLLMCSFLRHKGIPARIRYGFAPYIKFDESGFGVDHVVVEYWDEGRWKLSDNDLPDGAIEYFKLPFDIHDIPRDQFLVGGDVWTGVREDRLDANNFGVHPSIPDPDLRGEDFILGDLARDIAFLNKQEYLLWDMWGIMNDQGPMTDEKQTLLNRAADLSSHAHDDANFEAIRMLGAQSEFFAPEIVLCLSPVQASYTVTA